MPKSETPTLTTREATILTTIEAREMFGREIRDAYEKMGKPMPYGSLYTTLDRMEKAGLIIGRDGEPNPKLGGNRRRFYRISATGRRALEQLRDSIGIRIAPGAKFA